MSQVKADRAKSFRAGSLQRSNTFAVSMTPDTSFAINGSVAGSGLAVCEGVGSASEGGASVPRKDSHLSGVLPLGAVSFRGWRGWRYGSDVVALGGRPPRIRWSA